MAITALRMPTANYIIHGLTPVFPPVQFEGTIIPEPSVLGLLAFATTGVLALRRQRALR